MWTFNCGKGVGVPNPHVVQVSTVYVQVLQKEGLCALQVAEEPGLRRPMDRSIPHFSVNCRAQRQLTTSIEHSCSTLSKWK